MGEVQNCVVARKAAAELYKLFKRSMVEKSFDILGRQKHIYPLFYQMQLL